MTSIQLCFSFSLVSHVKYFSTSHLLSLFEFDSSIRFRYVSVFDFKINGNRMKMVRLNVLGFCYASEINLVPSPGHLYISSEFSNDYATIVTAEMSRM